MSDQPTPVSAADSPATALPVEVPASRAPSASSTGVSLFTAITVSAILSAFSAVVSFHFSSKQQSQPQVVVIDAAKIAEARVKQALSKPLMGADGAAKEGEEFMRQFNAVLDAYTASGVIVVNSSVTLNRPAGLDVTGAVATRLGVDLR